MWSTSPLDWSWAANHQRIDVLPLYSIEKAVKRNENRRGQHPRSSHRCRICDLYYYRANFMCLLSNWRTGTEWKAEPKMDMCILVTRNLISRQRAQRLPADRLPHLKAQTPKRRPNWTKQQKWRPNLIEDLFKCQNILLSIQNIRFHSTNKPCSGCWFVASLHNNQEKKYLVSVLGYPHQRKGALS